MKCKVRSDFNFLLIKGSCHLLPKAVSFPNALVGSKFFFYTSICLFVRGRHNAKVEVRGQLVLVILSRGIPGSKDGTQVIGVGVKHLSRLSPLNILKGTKAQRRSQLMKCYSLSKWPLNRLHGERLSLGSFTNPDP